MSKLSDTQLVLLTAAAARSDGSLLPVSASLSAQASRLSRSLNALITRALVVEAPVTDAALVWRSDGDQRLGAFITDAGRAVIGVEPAAPAAPEQGEALADATAGATAEPPRSALAAKVGSKSALVVDLLTRSDGATLAELVAATGWLPHTTRAALTGLRHKGHAITRGQRGGATCYRIAAAA